MKASYECPECKRPLASRRHNKCQYCGADLPKALLYSKAEIEAQNQQQDELEKKRKTREGERDEEDRKRRDDGGADDASMTSVM